MVTEIEREKLEVLFQADHRIKPNELDWLIDCWKHDYSKERDGEYKLEELLRYVFLKGYFFDKR